MTAMRGENYFGGAWQAGRGPSFCAYDPTREAELEPQFQDADSAQVAAAVQSAAAAFPAFRATAPATRAALLERIAVGVEALGATLLERAHQETGLPMPRLEAERGRTCGQLRMFARLIQSAAYLAPLCDAADPDRKPIPKPDLRRTKIAIGPVAVFGASNFPLAFSAVGGDTAAALAAGCTVIVKAHPAHPGTSELVARVLIDAVQALQLPDGTATFVQGSAIRVGSELVQHPSLAAVAFTGSLRGGRAIFDLAAQRAHPIPVYAEMGSVNPTVFLPGVLVERGAQIGRDLAASVTLGCGQFCTNPGLLFAIAGPATERFAASLQSSLDAAPEGVMLHRGIAAAYRKGVAEWSKLARVQRIDAAREASSASRAMPAFFRCDAATFMQTEVLREELFGPSTLLVTAANSKELLATLECVPGQLTAGIHATAADHADAEQVLRVLEVRAGRLIWNGYPTGVEVSPAMQHGGPYPATSDARVTSVGASSIERFLRPIAFQSFPSVLLPREIRDGSGACSG